MTCSLSFRVPASRDDSETAVLRLAAPRSIATTPQKYRGHVTVSTLPDFDADKNRRPWHAKMLALRAERYTALMIGSSNFTCAGLGTASHRNAEANLVTVVERFAYGREAGRLEAIWSQMGPDVDLEAAEWLGPQPEHDEIDLSPLAKALEGMPLRARGGMERVSERINVVRQALKPVEETLWKDLLSQASWRSPLLVMDEAHHLENPRTALAGLLQSPDTDRTLRTGDGAMAEEALRPWIVRHNKGTHWVGTKIERRRRTDGAAVTGAVGATGLPVPADQLLPFFLAARSAINPGKDLLGEALCSSYEAFRNTREQRASERDEHDKSSIL